MNTEPRPQTGYALVILLLLLLGGSALWLAVPQQRLAPAGVEGETARALQQARKGLLAYALLGGSSAGSPPRPGALPCPDRTGNGRIDSFPCLNAIHPGASQHDRLPWASLQLPPLTDAAGARLWYVLDPTLRNSPAAEPINPTHAGSLSVDGVAGHVAVVLAPGEAEDGDGRLDGAGAEAEDWLAPVNADATDSAYAGCLDDSDCHDRIAGIHRDRLFEPVQRRLLARLAEQLAAFHRDSAGTLAQRHLPWAAPLGASECETGRHVGSLPLAPGDCGPEGVLDTAGLPDWIDANDWLPLVFYHVDPRCTAAARDCADADLVLDGRGGHAAILAAAGAVLPGQSRTGDPPRAVADYLDHPDNAAADGHYTDHRPARPMIDNDAFHGLRLP